MLSSPIFGHGKGASDERSFIQVRTLVLLSILCLSAVGVLAAPLPVPTGKPTNYPAWWFSRGVIAQLSPTNSSPSWPTNYPISDDYSVINEGQLKNFASQAYNDLQANAPSFVWSTLPGTNLVSSVTDLTATNTDDFSVVNLGQLKTLAQPFYDVLNKIGYPETFSTTYPWTGTNADDWSAANIGQAKNAYGFDVGYDSDGNGLPDWWEIKYFGAIGTVTGFTTNSSPDGNGLTLLQDYEKGNNPTEYYSQNGSTSTPLTIITGNNQPAGSGIVLPQPLTVQVTGSSGNPLPNTTVTFTVTTGGGTISTSGTGTYTSSPVNVQTSSTGQAYVYFTTANPVASTNTITASITVPSSATVTFNEAAPPPSQLPNSGNNSQGSPSAPPGAYGVTPIAGPVPLNAYTGNASRIVDDLSCPAVGEIGLDWKRYLHTRLSDGYALFDNVGIWRHSFQWDFSFVTVGTQQQIEVVYPDGTDNFFALDGTSGIYRSTISVDDVITNPSPGNYKLIRSNNQVYNFASTTLNGSTIYYLASIYDSKGNKTTMTWGNPVIGSSDPNYWTLNKVTEPSGKSLTITYNLYSTGTSSTDVTNYGIFVQSVVTTDNRSVTYSYSAWATAPGANQTVYQYLSGAAYSDGTSASYQFGSSATGSNGPDPFELTQALDVRAEGIQQLDFAYYDYTVGLDAPVGTIVAIQEDSTQNVLEVNNITVNSQLAIVGYPDNGTIFTAYTYNLDSQGDVLSLTDSDPNHNINTTQYFSYTQNVAANTITATSTDGNGNMTTTVKTLGGQVLSRTYPIVAPDTKAPTESWQYTTDGNNFTYLSHYFDPNGNETSYSYSANPQSGQPQLLGSISYPDATSESYYYNSTLLGESPPICEVDHHLRRNGGTEYFTYYTTGQLETTQDAAQTSGQHTAYVYESSSGRIHTITDANSNITTLTYNDRGQVTNAQYAQASYADISHSSRTYGYDGLGRLNLLTDETGVKTGYNYDAYNRLQTVVLAPGTLNYTTTYGYDFTAPGNSSPVLVTSPTGKQKAFTYAMIWGYKAVQVTTEGPSGVNAASSYYGYDSAGNLISAEDPNLKTTLISYDARNRKALVTDPAGNVNDYYYDDNNNLTSLISPDGTTVNHYDTMNRLLNSTDPKGQESQYTYDAEGQLKTYTDPANSLYQYTYDKDERRLTMEYPDTTSEIYQYDAVGNLYTFTTRDSKVQTFYYDARNRNSSYTWSDSTPSVTKTYYDNDLIHTISNSNSAITYTFDAINRIQTEAQNITGLGSKTITYAFNTDNTANTLTYPDSTVLTYGYDGRNDVTTVTQSGVSTAVVTYGYDGNGNRTGKTLGNGVSSVLTYDNVERLSSITDSFSSTTLQSFSYGYDALSRAKYVKRSGGLGDVYTYDTSDQLTGIEYNATNPDTNPSSPSRTVSYTLDTAGNRKQVVDSSNGTTSYLPFNTSSPTNSNNQYTSIGGNAVSYDSRGDLTSYNSATYTYDAEGHLTQLVKGGATLTFYYDPVGRCVANYNTATSITTYSVYDLGWNTLLDYTASSSTPRGGTAALAQRYVHGADPDEILTNTALLSGQVTYFHNDGVGNITKLTNSSGAIVEQYTYDVFGTPTIENASGTVISATQYANRFLFAGREYISAANVYQYRNRAYSPDIGRFLQPDPIGHSGDGYNIYRFCGNDPVNISDPGGLDPNDGADFEFFSGGGSDFFSSGTTDSGTVIFSNFYFGSTPGNVSFSSGGSNTGNSSAAVSINQVPQNFAERQSVQTGAGESSFSVLDGVQATLTTAGFIPGLGELTNAASAVVSVFQGDWTGAGLSAAALVPFAGDVADAAKLARLGRKGVSATEVLRANRIAGKAAEAQAAIDLQAQGYKIIGSQVTARTSAGVRYIDHLIQTPEGEYFAVEVKAGNATRTSTQLLKDELMFTEGVTLGKNAGDLRGTYLESLDTVELHY